MPLRLILLGPPASGKGTQGRRIAERHGLDYLSTGALLREVLATGDSLSAEVAPVLARGGYVDDRLMCRIMSGWLAGRTGGWVLDGFPRTLAQDDFLRDSGPEAAVSAAVSLEVPRDELLRRVMGRVECPSCRWSGQGEDCRDGGLCPRCGAVVGRRADDETGNFLHRHEEYETHTVPVIRRYGSEGRLIRCDATRGIDEVSAILQHAIETIESHGQET